jgi:trk system potassium uptake protein
LGSENDQTSATPAKLSKEPGKLAADKFVFRVPGSTALRIPLSIPKPDNPLSSTLILIYSFSALIIIGTIFLILPISSASGHFTSPLNALFSATSAVCVTGLVVVDTGTYFSTFGQVVLFILFQLGGFGFIVGTTLLLFAIGGRLGLKDRLFISDSTGVEQFGNIGRIVGGIAGFSLILETVGVVVFYFQWQSIGAPGVSLWTAVFHSVSSFNNCGMDIFGAFQSLAGFRGDAITLAATALLVLLGSTGYLVVIDIFRHGRFNKLSLDSKIVVTTTFSLLAVGTLIYLIAEFSNPDTLGPLSVPQKFMVAFFQSVTPRTAGFSAINLGSLSQFALFFTVFLMFIGGGSGSTAGGLKVNTFGVLVLSILNVAKGNENINAFGRQIARQTVYRAITLFLLYLTGGFLVTLALSITESFSLDKLLFESVSALGTVGLSTGITPDLSIAGRFILVLAMFIGRLGPLSFMAFLAKRHQTLNLDFPRENVRLG